MNGGNPIPSDQTPARTVSSLPSHYSIARTFAPIVGKENGPLNKANQRGRGFGTLDPRGQQALKQGRQEKVPAEYRDIVNQYFKALSERTK